MVELGFTLGNDKNIKFNFPIKNKSSFSQIHFEAYTFSSFLTRVYKLSFCSMTPPR